MPLVQWWEHHFRKYVQPGHVLYCGTCKAKGWLEYCGICGPRDSLGIMGACPHGLTKRVVGPGTPEYVAMLESQKRAAARASRSPGIIGGVAVGDDRWFLVVSRTVWNRARESSVWFDDAEVVGNGLDDEVHITLPEKSYRALNGHVQLAREIAAVLDGSPVSFGLNDALTFLMNRRKENT